jgi:hypothetical protein
MLGLSVKSRIGFKEKGKMKDKKWILVRKHSESGFTFPFINAKGELAAYNSLKEAEMAITFYQPECVEKLEAYLTKFDFCEIDYV